MGKKKSFKITPKHRRFVRYFIVTGNISESGQLAGFNKSYAKELIAHPAITALVEQARQKSGLTDEMLERKHVELLHCGERSVELGATRLGYQVKKKIGSDDAPPPAVLPPVIIHIKGTHGASIASATTAAGTSGLRADGQAGVSIRRPNKP